MMKLQKTLLLVFAMVIFSCQIMVDARAGRSGGGRSSGNKRSSTNNRARSSTKTTNRRSSTNSAARVGVSGNGATSRNGQAVGATSNVGGSARRHRVAVARAQSGQNRSAGAAAVLGIASMAATSSEEEGDDSSTYQDQTAQDQQELFNGLVDQMSGTPQYSSNVHPGTSSGIGQSINQLPAH